MASENIDWEDLRDKYTKQILSDVKSSKRSDIEEMNKRRRLSSNDLIEVTSQTRRDREKKKKKKKSKGKAESRFRDAKARARARAWAKARERAKERARERARAAKNRKKPTSEPTSKPTSEPTATPTATPTFKPSSEPSVKPTFIVPTPSPTTEAAASEQGIYRYDSGNCPVDGSLGVPCAEGTNIDKVCNRYHELGSFAECWRICEPAFCCIHDADPDKNFMAPSCSKDENCAQYAYCYTVWFKFHDTFGPATYLNVEQKGSDFFDVPNSEVRSDRPQNGFFSQLYFHHFNDVVEIINRGRDSDGTFRLSNVFENPENWDTIV